MKEEDKYSFPLPYDIKEVLSNMTTANFNRLFAQRNGIFIPDGSQKTLGETLSLFFWDNDDINEIQNEAYQKRNIYALSGFTIETEYEIDLADALISFISNGDIGSYRVDTPIRLDNISKFKVYKSRIEYRKRKIAKLEFLQEEIVDFDFYLKENEDNSWQVEIDSKSSKNQSIIKDIYRRNLRIKNHIDEIEIGNLSVDSTILFFDKLRQEGLNNDWEFSNIKHLTLRRPKSTKDSEDGEEHFDAPEDEVSGITQAILAGHNLREHPFVKKSEEDGYIFTSMTYLFYKKSEPLAIHIKAEFKGSPKVFEISILRSVEIEGVNQVFKDITLEKKLDLELRTEFWNNARRIYDRMKMTR